jgi:hypothetical protein
METVEKVKVKPSFLLKERKRQYAADEKTCNPTNRGFEVGCRTYRRSVS